MDQPLIDIRDQQKETWNKFSPGWKKWDEFTMNFLKPMGDAIIEELDIQPADNVLDVAAGTGEPGLTIAALATEGKVTSTDLAEQMLAIAAENAKQKGINNFETKVADICELPFSDNSFDKISCRMGFMFFPDMQMAANEMYRVLKSGGKIATSVWAGPQNNVWITAIMGVINRNMQLPPPPPGSPGMFRCAEPGFIGSLLTKSGFTEVHEREVRGKVEYNDFEHYWQMMNEVAAPVVGALSKADDQMREKIKSEVKEMFNQYKEGEDNALEYSSLVISARKG